MSAPDIHELAMAVNTLTVQVAALTKAQENHQKAVDELTNTLEKGKGVFWILSGLATFGVAIAAIWNK